MAPVDSFPKKQNWQSRFSQWIAGFLYTGGLEYVAEEAGAASEAAISSGLGSSNIGAVEPQFEPESIEMTDLGESRGSIPTMSGSSSSGATRSFVNPAYEPEDLTEFTLEESEHFDYDLDDPLLSNAEMTSTPIEPEVRPKTFVRQGRRPQVRRRFDLEGEPEVVAQRGKRGLIAKRIKQGWRPLRGRVAGRNEEEFFEMSSINDEGEEVLFDRGEYESNVDDDELMYGNDEEPLLDEPVTPVRARPRSKPKLKSAKKIVSNIGTKPESETRKRTKRTSSGSSSLAPAAKKKATTPVTPSRTRSKTVSFMINDSEMLKKPKGKKKKCKYVKGKKKCKRLM
ncbi:L2 [Wels catfish papillomavirus 1]|nr:L2 [Wels catfish papillomavirus 1]